MWFIISNMILRYIMIYLDWFLIINFSSNTITFLQTLAYAHIQIYVFNCIHQLWSALKWNANSVMKSLTLIKKFPVIFWTC
jgi:hypothetical protein